MGTRRRFLGSVLALGAGLGLVPKATAASRVPDPSQGNQHPKGYAWQSTLFCQAQDAKLLAEAGHQARLMGLDLYLGRPQAPDIFAIPYFIAIIDRRTVPEDVWAEFLDYRQEVEDQTPILVVDALGPEAPSGLDDGMQVVDPGSQAGMRQVRQAITEAHRVALRWEPEWDLG